MIEITGVDLPKFVKDVYALSGPQGLGFLHARPGDLDDETVADILSRGSMGCLLNMDYVHGRACKMGVQQRGDRLFIYDQWYDHSDDQLDELLTRHGIDKTNNTVSELPQT